MAQLAEFKIQDDNQVWLSFADGKQRTVKFNKLSKHVTPVEERRIYRARRLRFDFLRKYLPPWAKVVVIPIILVLLGVGMAKANQINHRHQANQVAPTTASVSTGPAILVAPADSSSIGQQTNSGSSNDLQAQSSSAAQGSVPTNDVGQGSSSNVAQTLQPIVGGVQSVGQTLQSAAQSTKDVVNQLGL